jgi:hypothetical protein
VNQFCHMSGHSERLEQNTLAAVLRLLFCALREGVKCVAGGLNRMTSGDQYEARARECIEAADRLITHPENRLALLELARRWMRLALQVDARQDRNGATGNALLDPPGNDQHSH